MFADFTTYKKAMCGHTFPPPTQPWKILRTKNELVACYVTRNSYRGDHWYEDKVSSIRYVAKEAFLHLE